MDNRPIGLLDSGVGGLTVARELLRQLPNEEIVYIGDTRRAPYGPRSREQIIAFTWDMVNFLLSKNVKMIVMACNTATAMALEIVKEELDIPVKLIGFGEKIDDIGEFNSENFMRGLLEGLI